MAGVSSTTWAVMTVYIAGHFPDDRLDATMGLLYAISNVAQLTASAFGAHMVESWGWRAPFLASLFAAVIGLALMPFLGREQRQAASGTLWSDLSCVARRPLILFVCYWGSWFSTATGRWLGSVPSSPSNLGPLKGRWAPSLSFIWGRQSFGCRREHANVPGRKRTLAVGFTMTDPWAGCIAGRRVSCRIASHAGTVRRRQGRHLSRSR